MIIKTINEIINEGFFDKLNNVANSTTELVNDTIEKNPNDIESKKKLGVLTGKLYADESSSKKK